MLDKWQSEFITEFIASVIKCANELAVAAYHSRMFFEALKCNLMFCINTSLFQRLFSTHNFIGF